MNGRDLPRVERPVCASCGVMVPEVEVPLGDGSAQCCWLCAHGIVDHGAQLGYASGVDCRCTPEEIYPADVMRLRVARNSPLLDTGRVSYDACDTANLPRTQTLVTRCYKLDGTVDENGPKLVQTFEHVGPGKLMLKSVSIREQTRGEKISRGMRRESATTRPGATARAVRVGLLPPDRRR